MSEKRIAAIRLLCPDVELTAAFYEAAFGAATIDGGQITIGHQTVSLVPTNMRRTRPSPGNATSFQHFAIIVSDMDAAMAHLESVPGWKPISTNGPVRLPASSGGVTAFKFRDLDGHPLELLAFPPDATPDAWRNADGLFLGIDHTAISVQDTAQSIAFFAQFGFSVSNQTINQGPEQAALDAVDTPVVEVTGLTLGGARPNLELLCYRRPDVIADARGADDILSTVTILADAKAGEPAIRLDPDGHRIGIG